MPEKQALLFWRFNLVVYLVLSLISLWGGLQGRSMALTGFALYSILVFLLMLFRLYSPAFEVSPRPEIFSVNTRRKPVLTLAVSALVWLLGMSMCTYSMTLLSGGVKVAPGLEAWGGAAGGALFYVMACLLLAPRAVSRVFPRVALRVYLKNGEPVKKAGHFEWIALVMVMIATMAGRSGLYSLDMLVALALSLQVMKLALGLAWGSLTALEKTICNPGAYREESLKEW